MSGVDPGYLALLFCPFGLMVTLICGTIVARTPRGGERVAWPSVGLFVGVWVLAFPLLALLFQAIK